MNPHKSICLENFNANNFSQQLCNYLYWLSWCFVSFILRFELFCERIIIYVLSAVWYFPVHVQCMCLFPKERKCFIEFLSLGFPVKYHFPVSCAFICILLIPKPRFGMNALIRGETVSWHGLHGWSSLKLNVGINGLFFFLVLWAFI